MMGARVLVSRAVRVARRTRQPLCAAFWFAAPLRRPVYTRPAGVGCIERRVLGRIAISGFCLLVSYRPLARHPSRQTLPIAIYKSV